MGNDTASTAVDTLIAETSASSLSASLVRRILPYGVLRRSPPFARLTLSHSLVMPADWLYIVAVFAVAYSQTHSTTIVGLLTVTRLLPPAVSAPLSGALADRRHREMLLAAANVGRAGCVLVLLTVNLRTALPLAFVLVFVIAILSGIYRPALNAAVPSVVRQRDLLEANTIMGQVDMMSYGLGPGLGGLFVLLGRPELALGMTAGFFLLATGIVLTVHLPQPARGEPGKRWISLSGALTGFTFLVRHNAGVPAAFVVSIGGLSLLSGAYWALAGELSVETLHLGSQGMGFLSGAYGLGGLLAGIAVRSVASTRSLDRVFIAAIVISSVAAGFFGLSIPGPLPFLWNGVMGAADVFSVVCTITVLQIATPGRLLGRVFGAYECALILSMACGALIVGPVVAIVGARLATVLLAAVGPLSLLCCLPWLLKLDSVLGLRLFLHRVPVLATLSGDVLDTLTRCLHLERLPAGATVILEGDLGDGMYFIKSGSVEIRQRGSSAEERVVRTLGPGDYMGEIALLRETPRTATVRAIEAVELYRLSRVDFRDLTRRSTELHDALERGMKRYTGAPSGILLRR